MSSEVAELERVTAGLPDGWASGPVLDFFQLQRGHDLPVQDRKPGSVPIIASNGPVGWHDHSPITGPGVITGRSGTIGKVSYVEGSYWPLNTTLYVRDFKGSDPRFVFYFLQNFPLTDHQSGTGVPTLNRNDVHAVWTAFPPLNVQRRIAEVLRSVDEAISAEQEYETQAKAVRAALLSEHFHMGDWANDVPLPHGWQLNSLDKVAERGSGHTPNKKIEAYWNGGIKWVSLQDTKRLDQVYISETAQQISAQGIANSSAVLHPDGVVVISRDATVGRSAITVGQMAVSQHFIAYRCGPALDNHYLYYWLQRMKPVFERIGAGSTIKTIGLPFFKSLRIALPPIALQKEMAVAMLDVDKSIMAAAKAIRSLTALKAAIMSDILSGRVRVPA